MSKTYTEAMRRTSFEERFDYLKLDGRVGASTFGSKRYLNQALYRLPEWKKVRREAIVRDGGCNLAHPDYLITAEPIYVHHINPITIEDILNRDPIVLDLENLICTVHMTHEALHYGDKSLLPILPEERKPFDTCPWR